MKKAIIVVLVVLFSTLGMAQFKYLEPDILPNGVGKLSIGFDTFMRYGILDIVEVGFHHYRISNLVCNLAIFGHQLVMVTSQASRIFTKVTPSLPVLGTIQVIFQQV
jgi:hypothetical protein